MRNRPYRIWRVQSNVRERYTDTGRSIGDYEAGELLQPPLTTVKFDWKNWGEISAESMIQMILGKPVSPLQVNPYEIIERKSVKEN